MNTTQINLLTAPGRGRRPNLTLAQQIALLERSIQALRDAGLDASYYQTALATLKGVK